MSFIKKITSFIGLLAIIISVVIGIYLIIALFMPDYVERYPILIFMIAAISSFIVTFLVLYFFKIRKTSMSENYWKNYWNITELVWLLGAFLALLIGINKYTDIIIPHSFDIEYMAKDYFYSSEEKKLSSLKNETINIIDYYYFDVCSSKKKLNISIGICNYANKLKKLLNKNEYTIDSLYNITAEEREIESSLYDNLQFLLYFLSERKDFSKKEYWDKVISYHVDRAKLTEIHYKKYLKKMALCDQGSEDFCTFLSNFYIDDKKIKKEKKKYYKRVLKINYFYEQLVSGMNKRQGRGYASEILSTLYSMRMIREKRLEKNDSSKKINKLDAFFSELSIIINKRRRFISTLLPLLLGSAFGLRFSKAVAAFKI